MAKDTGRSRHQLVNLGEVTVNGVHKSVRLFGENLDEGMHICTFFRSSAERYRVLMPFIREGIEQGDRALHIINPSLRSEHAQRIAEAGIDAARAEGEGRLEIIGWDEAPLCGGSFNQSAMLSLLPVLLNDGRARGFAVTRFIADMSWALNDPGCVDRLLEYECRLNLALPKADDIVICAYDLDKFSAAIVIDALRTHPIVLIGGIVQRNPFYVPPDDLLKELNEREPTEAGGTASA
ncbi:MAG TPA: MEDS domain-containing protein [Bryobacteraceae bacterium]|nr:MEDS domain-containing protein [Bryobacteraceae bacterium]